MDSGNGGGAAAAAAAAADSGEESTEERRMLNAVSIPQQFAWTRLASTKKLESNFWLQDLLLWNVLGFAVDERDYLNLSLVSKEWRRMVQILEPPIVFQMNLLLNNNDFVETTAITQDSVQHLVPAALESLQNRESPLYRNNDDNNSWPFVQPRFQVILMRFVYGICCQRNNTNSSQRLYEIITNFLTTMTQNAVDTFFTHATDDDDMLNKFVTSWTAWKGIVDTVDDMANYLNRFYIPHHNHVSLKDHAKACLVRAVVDSHLETAAAFVREARIQFSSNQEHQLVLKALDACEILQCLPWPPYRTRHVREEYRLFKESLAPTLERAREEEEEAPQEQSPITIICAGDTTPLLLPQDSPFLKASGFFKRLHLKGGDTIRLASIDGTRMRQMVEFCNLDNTTPMPVIPRPLGTNDLESVVGPIFSNYLDRLGGQEGLFSMIVLANLMDTKKLMDLGTAAIAAMIIGRSREEIRVVFGIANEFTPEEEEQVRRENAWLEQA